MNMIHWLKDRIVHRRNGLLRQAPDKRDYRLASTEAPLKAEVDLRSFLSTPRNQGSTQACTGFAVAALFEAFANKHTNLLGYSFSPLYNWYYAKKIHGWENENKGVWLRNSLKALYAEGLPPEDTFPFTGNLYRTPDADAEALGELSKKALVKTAYFLIEPEDIKTQLSKGRVTVFGLMLNNSFYGNRTGIITDDSPGSGAHAMLAVGYNKEGDYLVRNSWGDWWGEDGYCTIPANYLLANSFDCWTIDLLKNKEE